MSKFEEALTQYMGEFTKIGVKNVDADLLRAVTKACGPSIYKADASKVASSDPEELKRVKTNFLIKKLGLKDDAKLDEGISSVVGILGSDNRNKYRAMFYYLLVKHFKKESIFA